MPKVGLENSGWLEGHRVTFHLINASLHLSFMNTSHYGYAGAGKLCMARRIFSMVFCWSSK